MEGYSFASGIHEENCDEAIRSRITTIKVIKPSIRAAGQQEEDALSKLKTKLEPLGVLKTVTWKPSETMKKAVADQEEGDGPLLDDLPEWTGGEEEEDRMPSLSNGDDDLPPLTGGEEEDKEVQSFTEKFYDLVIQPVVEEFAEKEKVRDTPIQPFIPSLQLERPMGTGKLIEKMQRDQKKNVSYNQIKNGLPKPHVQSFFQNDAMCQSIIYNIRWMQLYHHPSGTRMNTIVISNIRTISDFSDLGTEENKKQLDEELALFLEAMEEYAFHVQSKKYLVIREENESNLFRFKELGYVIDQELQCWKELK